MSEAADSAKEAFKDSPTELQVELASLPQEKLKEGQSVACPGSDLVAAPSPGAKKRKLNRSALWFLAFLICFPMIWMIAYVALQNALSQLCCSWGVNIFTPTIVALRAGMLFGLPAIIFLFSSFRWPRLIGPILFAVFFWWCFGDFVGMPTSSVAFRICRSHCLRPVNAVIVAHFLGQPNNDEYYPGLCDGALNERASTILKDLDEKHEYQSLNSRFVCRLLVFDSLKKVNCYRVELNEKGKPILYASSWEHINADTGKVLDQFSVRYKVQRKEVELPLSEYEKLLKMLQAECTSLSRSNVLREAKYLFEYQIGTRYYFMNTLALPFLEELEQKFGDIEKSGYIGGAQEHAEMKTREIPAHPLYKQSLLRLEREAKEKAEQQEIAKVVAKPKIWPMVLRDKQTKAVVTTSWLDDRMAVKMELCSTPAVLESFKENSEIYALFFEDSSTRLGTHVPVHFDGQSVEKDKAGGLSRLLMKPVYCPLPMDNYQRYNKIQVIYFLKRAPK